MTRRIFLAFAFLLAALDLAAADVSAKLTLDPAVTTSPVPVSLSLAFTNAGENDFRDVPRKAILIVTPEKGEPFIALWRGSKVADLGPASGIAQVTVPPRGSADLELLANPFFDSPGWFTDPRLYAAGKKQLQVVFSDALDDSADLTRLADGIVSSKATLEVRPAVGDDAKACAFLREQLARDEPCPLHALKDAALIRQLWNRFPKSTWRDYVASRVEGDPPTKIALLEKATAARSGPAYWWNLLSLARLYETTGASDKALAAWKRLAGSPKVYFRDLAKERLVVLGIK